MSSRNPATDKEISNVLPTEISVED